MFTYSGFGHRYCDNCKEFDLRDFDAVRNYIFEHGTATMVEVTMATGVEMKYIEQYLREGRLEIPENSKIFIKCELCNVDIRFGRYCKDCAVKMSKDFKGVLDEYEIGEKPKKTKLEGKLHFLGKYEI